jgi:hypothetical protein
LGFANNGLRASWGFLTCEETRVECEIVIKAAACKLCDVLACKIYNQYNCTNFEKKTK